MSAKTRRMYHTILCIEYKVKSFIAPLYNQYTVYGNLTFIWSWTQRREPRCATTHAPLCNNLSKTLTKSKNIEAIKGLNWMWSEARKNWWLMILSVVIFTVWSRGEYLGVCRETVRNYQYSEKKVFIY